MTAIREVVVTIHCDECPCAEQLEAGSACAARRTLKARGWLYLTHGETSDLCPSCAARRSKAKSS